MRKDKIEGQISKLGESKLLFVVWVKAKLLTATWLFLKLRNQRFPFGRAGSISSCHKHICHLRTVLCHQLTNLLLRMHFCSWQIIIHIPPELQPCREWQLVSAYNPSTFLYWILMPDTFQLDTDLEWIQHCPSRHPNPSYGLDQEPWSCPVEMGRRLEVNRRVHFCQGRRVGRSWASYFPKGWFSILLFFALPWGSTEGMSSARLSPVLWFPTQAF